MNLASNDNPVLVAPRPVRLHTVHPVRYTSAWLTPSPAAELERVRIGENADPEGQRPPLGPEISSGKEFASPRLSPRSGLPSEALEEFLSILRPSYLPHVPAGLKFHRSHTSLAVQEHLSLRSRAWLDLTHQADDDGLIEVTENKTPPSGRNIHPGTPESLSSDEYFRPEKRDTETAPYHWLTTNTLCSIPHISHAHPKSFFAACIKSVCDPSISFFDPPPSTYPRRAV
ncbi:hypothetical protein AX17_003354 [Amanita inopinata Kibby_2008]|nr:hypothetical protein AX17_003354 [Amanita inopinata Kibby_2008]